MSKIGKIARNGRKKFGKTKRKVKRLFEKQPRLKFQYGYYYKHGHVRENWILFESFHGKTISDSPLYMLKEFVASGQAKNFKIFYASADVKTHQRFVKEAGLPVELVDIKSKRYQQALAECKYLVNNSSFPAYFIRKDEQVYVQTWHGTPLKTLGKSMRLGIESMYNVQHNFLQANYITFPNDYTREVIMRDYNLEKLFTGTVAMTGYPRNDVFTKHEQDPGLRRKYGLDGSFNIAYMPTWRGTSNHDIQQEEYRKEVQGIFSELDAVLADDQHIYVNFHPLVTLDFDSFSYKHISLFPKEADGYEFLNEMDALITDYSSVFFDYSLTGKPIVLFLYDIEEYLRDRGMYFDIETLPFEKAYSTKELIGMLQGDAFTKSGYLETDYVERYLKYDTPQNSRNVLDLLLTDSSDAIVLDSYAANKERPWHVQDLGRLKTNAEIDLACKSADPQNDIVVFQRSRFSMGLSAHLHDNYRDALEFVFITRTVPRTYLEDITKRFNKATEQRLHEREIKRVFPGLSINPEFQTTAYISEAETAFVDPKMPGLAGRIESDGERAYISVDDSSYELHKVMLTTGRFIQWCRPLTEHERGLRIIAEDFRDYLASGKAKNRQRPVIAVEASRSGQKPAMYRVISSFERDHGDDYSVNYRSPITHGPWEFTHEELDSCALLRKEREITVTPYVQRNSNRAAVLITLQGQNLRRYVFAKASRIRIAADGTVYLKGKVRTSERMRIIDIVFRSRNEVAPLEYHLDYTLRKTARWTYFYVRFNPARFTLDEIYYDVLLRVEFDGVIDYLQLRVGTPMRLRFFTSANLQCPLPAGFTAFPYRTIGGYLAFTVREASPYDTAEIRRREFAACFVFAILHPYWKRKKIWLVYEKFCSTAQDNGYYFFKYCMDERKGAKKHVFYVLDPASPDHKNVEQYADNVLDFMSFKHLLYAMSSTIYVASDSRSHLYIWRTKPSLVRDRISHHKILFLQHGVTALKDVSGLFGKKGSNSMTYFLTTSEKEQEVVIDNLGYTSRQAPILGFSRWDMLDDKSSRTEPMILLMPTWRPWLEDQSDELFTSSEYFERYLSFINSKSLHELLEQRNARLVFYIHPKLADKLDAFAAQNERVELVRQGDVQLNELIMRSSLLITDYSSVCWDELFMRKPVLYYQFDQDRYLQEVGALIDFTELPGPVCFKEDDAIRELEACMERGFTMTPEHEKIADSWFESRDKKNRERTYNFLVERGLLKKGY